MKLGILLMALFAPPPLGTEERGPIERERDRLRAANAENERVARGLAEAMRPRWPVHGPPSAEAFRAG